MWYVMTSFNKTARPRYLLLLLLPALLLPAVAHAAPPAPFAAPYADAMRPQFAGDVERPDLPHYTVHMDINPVGGELHASSGSDRKARRALLRRDLKNGAASWPATAARARGHRAARAPADAAPVAVRQ